MESVAARAHTGIAVLYRRWPNKDALTHAALAHYRATHPAPEPDTGSLRGDLLALLTAMSASPVFGVTMAAVSAGLAADSGLTMAQGREQVLGGRPVLPDRIFRRAHDRGEIDLDRIPAAVLALPFDLTRHDLFMGPTPVPAARLRSIVDELFLPLVRSAP
jgi:AcrR family transcriptional regulator